jgi:hypothetical protein
VKIRKTRLGIVVQCDHEYLSPRPTGDFNPRTPRRVLGPCEIKYVTACTDKSVVAEQLRLAGWERIRSPGGISLFCPDHTRKAIAERERAKRERATERIWR